jgi:hypothetical protein
MYCVHVLYVLCACSLYTVCMFFKDIQQNAVTAMKNYYLFAITFSANLFLNTQGIFCFYLSTYNYLIEIRQRSLIDRNSLC